MLLLDRASAEHEAQWHLRTVHADMLEHLPTARTVGIFRAAYPLAFGEEIAAAESEGHVPVLLLQALAREESAYDAKVVSWAGAYGLTQLLLSSGRGAGKLLTPVVSLAQAEDLLDPRLNARLGGALLGNLLHKLGDYPPLALAAYNASEALAVGLWKKHAGEPLDVMAEEIGIKETRGYVMRVTKTWGIYRWLYSKELPLLPAARVVPGHQ
jgi:soluble lytic murein transglycosylase